MTSCTKNTVDVRRFLLALFADVVADKNYKRRFKSGHRDLHRFFWDISQNQDTKVFVADLLFDINGNYPHSSQIDEILQEFQLSGLLARPNPTYKYNDIAFTSHAYAEEFCKELLSKYQQSYEQISNNFKQKLCIKFPD